MENSNGSEEHTNNPFDVLYKDNIMYLIYKEEKNYKVALRKQTANVRTPEKYEWRDLNPESISENPGFINIIDPPDKALWICCFYVYPHFSAYRALLSDDQPNKLFREENKQKIEIFIVDHLCKVYDFTGNAKISYDIEVNAKRTQQKEVCVI